MDSFLCMHHVGFNVCNDMHFSLIVKFPGFIIAVMADQISKLLKRCILDEMYASLLYLKVISHVTLMFVYRE